ncbi:MAG: cytochrome P460 family protein [bacterium]
MASRQFKLSSAINRHSVCNILVFIAATFILGNLGCSKDDGPPTRADDTGFEATIQDFQNYAAWPKIDYTVYPVNSSILGAAHEGNVPTRVREIWMKTTGSPNDPTYSRGTIIVKETHGWTNGGEKTWPEMGGLLAMVKRGGTFNPTGGGWEYLMLSNDGRQILARGANLMDGMCMSCHSLATGSVGKDFVFRHPSSVNLIASGSEWAYVRDIPTWERIDSTYGPDPFLSGVHGQTEDFSREIYRQQPAARAVDGAFPVGTAIAKIVSKMDDRGNRIYPGMGGITVMVKRGGGYDTANGDWEWFMFSQSDSTVARGNGAQMEMCVSCHRSATNRGADFVFRHPGLGN